VKKRQRLKRLAWSEYLPLAATAAMWGIVVLAIGHADTARLLAAITMIRAIQNLTKLSTPTALKRRIYAPKAVRRQAKRYAFALQLAALAVALVLVALLVEALKLIDQHQIAAFLPYIALGMPARCLRLSDVRTASPYFRLALAGSGFAAAAVAWAAAWPVTLLGLVFGLREWVAYVALRWWPREPDPPKYEVSELLKFEEVARYSAILGRRMLTYRLTKSLLTVFGPFGNAAARTGRGLDFYRKIEPYLPHHFGGFVAFSLVTIGAAIFVAERSGEPAAMILAAGLLHIGATTANVALLWNYLPARGSETEPIYDDDE
jgi:hypothetical protein